MFFACAKFGGNIFLLNGNKNKCERQLKTEWENVKKWESKSTAIEIVINMIMKKA